MKEPIHKVTLKDGSTRYRLVVDAARDENSKRKQITRTCDTQREARDEWSRIRHETNQGSYVRPSKETLSSYLDDYLKGATRGRRASTKRKTTRTRSGPSASGSGRAPFSPSPRPMSRSWSTGCSRLVGGGVGSQVLACPAGVSA
jgi:hypothetical protein